MKGITDEKAEKFIIATADINEAITCIQNYPKAKRLIEFMAEIEYEIDSEMRGFPHIEDELTIRKTENVDTMRKFRFERGLPNA